MEIVGTVLREGFAMGAGIGNIEDYESVSYKFFRRYGRENYRSDRELQERERGNGSNQKSADKYKFSIDTIGNEFSPQQAEYFKDSKVRDENGNLRVMYHGSRNSFNTFDINSPVQNGRIHGDGFYFTPNKDSAEAWANGDMEDMGQSYDTNVYEAYVVDDSGMIYLIKLSVANAVTGEKVLYDISKITKAEQSWNVGHVSANRTLSAYKD